VLRHSLGQTSNHTRDHPRIKGFGVRRGLLAAHTVPVLGYVKDWLSGGGGFLLGLLRRSTVLVLRDLPAYAAGEPAPGEDDHGGRC
jgi:hypothetical protein